mgnify:CR=1 FL=1
MIRGKGQLDRRLVILVEDLRLYFYFNCVLDDFSKVEELINLVCGFPAIKALVRCGEILLVYTSLPSRMLPCLLRSERQDRS